MAVVPRILTPWGTYSLLKDQLGSVREVYLRGDSVRPRGDLGEHRELVLLIHGFFQTRNIWEVMEDRLRFDGYGVMSFNIGGLLWRFNTHPVDRTAAMIAEKIEIIRQRYGFDRIHIIGHSKGGLIARRYVQHYGGDKRVKSVITLGTPHHGTPTAAVAVALMGFGAVSSSASDLLPGSGVIQRLSADAFPGHIPLTSIYSRADLVCPYWCSVLRPRPGESHLSNAEFSGLGHSELVWDGSVYRKVREQLDHASAIWAERVRPTHEGRIP